MSYGKNLTPWPLTWKSIGFQTLIRTKYVPRLIKIQWRMLILECSQGCHTVKIWLLDLWLENQVKFVPHNILVNTRESTSFTGFWPILVHMLHGKKNYPVTLTFDLWPWKSIGFQILLRTKSVPSLVKIHLRMLILECSQECYVRTDGR
jgi:hypothetical protein